MSGTNNGGRSVGVFITPADPQATKFTIEVVSLKRSQMQITGQDWKQTIIVGIKAELNI